jgi:TonB family protein
MAIVISAVIHSILLVPFCKFTPAEANKPVVVDYIKIKEPEDKVRPRPERMTKTTETPKVQLVKKVEMTASRAAAEKAAAAKKEARELAKKQAPLRNTKDYINYYQLIREKIRQALKERYKRSYGEGDVTLIFMLDSDGLLAAIDTNEAGLIKDPALNQLAMESVKAASPFPPFPKELSVPKMTFDLTISFKKE